MQTGAARTSHVAARPEIVETNGQCRTRRRASYALAGLTLSRDRVVGGKQTLVMSVATGIPQGGAARQKELSNTRHVISVYLRLR